MYLRLLLLLIGCSAAFATTRVGCVDWDFMIRVEDVANLHGGIKTGNVVEGEARLIGTYAQVFKFGILGAAHNERQFLYTGAIQRPTSLDVQGEFRIAELSYRHYFNPRLSGLIGIFDMEDFYDITEAAEYMRNTAFVNGMALDKNTSLVSFPYPGFGAMLDYRANNHYILLGLFQGNPQHLKTVFYQGFMLIAEVGGKTYTQFRYMQTFSLKGGVWMYQADNTPGYINNRGFYVIPQISWQYAAHTMDAFLQFDYCDETPKYIPYSLTLGARANNIFCKDNRDFLTFGIAKIWTPNIPSEVALELSYAYKFFDKCYITPDLQYIIKPSGILPNATVFLVRFNYSF